MTSNSTNFDAILDNFTLNQSVVSWGATSAVVGNNIYYVPYTTFNFTSFNANQVSITTTLPSVPDGYGAQCVVSLEYENKWYIYSIGGTQEFWYPVITSIFEYDVSNGTWTNGGESVGDLTEGTYHHNCISTYYNNLEYRIYVFGGRINPGGDRYVNKIEYCIVNRIDGFPYVNCNLLSSALSEKRKQGAAIQLNWHLLVVMGGTSNTSSIRASD